MIIKSMRKNFTEKSTISEVYINGIWQMYFLEDRDRQIQEDGSILPWTSGLKIPKVTAIPYGTYEIVISFSDRFKKLMPLLLKVPNFEGIRIHSGNTDKDTEGCLLTGTHKNPNEVIGSKIAYDKLFSILQSALKKEKVFITIEPFVSLKPFSV